METVLPVSRRVRADRSVAAIVGASLLVMTGAFAAEEGPQKPQEPADLAEVVVSVERVTQTLQSYAGTAVTATQAQLDSLGATNLVDIPSILPGVEISNYEDNTNIYVRGIGSDANTELGDPAVAPHLDDVYVPRPRGLQVAFFDIDRVEVKAFAVPGGMADWVISGTYKTRQYLTAFNGGPGNNSARDVTAVDAKNNAIAYGAEELRLFDKVKGYFHMDLGLGYTHEASNARVELYVNNVTDEAHATQAGIDTRTQELVFNPPRTYGVRMQVSF